MKILKLKIGGKVATSLRPSGRTTYDIATLLFISAPQEYTVLGAPRLLVRQSYDVVMNYVHLQSRQYVDLTYRLVFKKTWLNGMNTGYLNIYQQVAFSQQQISQILVRTPVSISKKMFNSISSVETNAVEQATYAYKVYLDGADMTHKVETCNITYSFDRYCGECSIVWADQSVFEQLDPSNRAKTIRLVVLAGYAGESLLQQGMFLLEKRSTQTDYTGSKCTSWGRSSTARLAAPCSAPVIKTWDVDTDAATIARELVGTAFGILLRWEIPTFPVLGGNFSSVSSLPIDLIGTLASAIGGIVTTNKNGDLVVRYRYRYQNG